MNKIRFALLATAASGALSIAGWAYAANNEALISQTGSDNTASINQTNAGAETSDNKFGSSTNIAAQDGELNALNITQSGDNNVIGLSGDGVDQLGANNGFDALQATDDNTIGSVQQSESTAAGADGQNYLRIKQQVGDNNVVSTVTQVTTANGNNRAILRQDGANNRYKSISQSNNGDGTNNIVLKVTGDSNGTADTLTNFAALSGANGSEITQSGTNNEIKFFITGSSNQFGAVQTNDAGGTNKVNTINITGDTNEIGISQVAHSATDDNSLQIESIIGNSNNVGASQQGYGTNSAFIDLGDSSNSNWAKLIQRNGATAKMTVHTGDYNRLSIEQYAATSTDNDAEMEVTSSDQTRSNNHVYIRQYGNAEVAKTYVTGDFNYSSIQQTASGNNATVTIVGDSNKNFTYQNDYSTDNTASISINGDSNKISSYQQDHGTDNEATIDVNGDRNTVENYQLVSSSSDMDLSIDGSDNIITSTQNNATSSSVSFDITGDSNQFEATQLLSSNDSITATIFGSTNGKGTWSAGGVAESIGLTSGYLTQSGSNNSMDLSIGTALSDSSNNLVAAWQNGDGNAIDLTISGGDFNEVAIRQQGNGNVSVVTQIGSSNIVGITQ